MSLGKVGEGASSGERGLREPGEGRAAGREAAPQHGPEWLGRRLRATSGPWRVGLLVVASLGSRGSDGAEGKAERILSADGAAQPGSWAR